MQFSVNRRPYDMREARENKSYASRFTYGWETVDTSQSEVVKRIITTRVWSPCVFRDGYRSKDTFVKSRLLALDFDSPGYSLEQALREWCDTVHWIGTTKNHQRDKGGIVCDRFRIVVPYESEITDPALYNYNYTKASQRYDAADQGTKDTARLFFPCQSVVSVCLDGEMQPIVPLPREYHEEQARIAAAKQAKVENRIIPRHIRNAFNLPIPIGKRSNTIYGVSKELSHYGFTYEQLREMFLTSATFRPEVLSQNDVTKIERTIQNGIKANRRGAESSAV